MNRRRRATRLLAPLLVALALLPVSQAGADERPDEEESRQHPTEEATPEGYTRDEQGRLFQTSFDMRRRYHLGVYDMLRLDEPVELGAPAHSLAVDLGGTYEFYIPERAHRHRLRFLEGQLTLAPFEIDALLYGHEWSRLREEATIWVSTFVGEPRRFDVPLEIGLGYSAGRLHYRRTDPGTLLLVDLAAGYLTWEIYQGERLENYLLFRTGFGVGLRNREEMSDAVLYAFPDLGLQSAWTLDRAGLTQLALEGRVQWSWEPRTAQWWSMSSAAVTLERIVLAINDQPISLFARPQLRHTRIEEAGIASLDLRAMIGARLSLFVPTRAAQAKQPW